MALFNATQGWQLLPIVRKKLNLWLILFFLPRLCSACAMLNQGEVLLPLTSGSKTQSGTLPKRKSWHPKGFIFHTRIFVFSDVQYITLAGIHVALEYCTKQKISHKKKYLVEKHLKITPQNSVAFKPSGIKIILGSLYIALILHVHLEPTQLLNLCSEACPLWTVTSNPR